MGENRYLIFWVETDASAICEKFHKLIVSAQKHPPHFVRAVVWSGESLHSIFCVPLPVRQRGVFFESPSARMQGKKRFSREAIFQIAHRTGVPLGRAEVDSRNSSVPIHPTPTTSRIDTSINSA